MLRRIIDVISFICDRDLAFKGSDQDVGSTHYGNDVGVLELVSKYDQFFIKIMCNNEYIKSVFVLLVLNLTSITNVYFRNNNAIYLYFTNSFSKLNF